MSPGTELANLLEAELPSEDQAIPLDVFDGSSPEDVLGLTDEANLFEVVHAKRQGTLADLRTVGDNDSDGTPPTITRLARPIPEKMTIEEQQVSLQQQLAVATVLTRARVCVGGGGAHLSLSVLTSFAGVHQQGHGPNRRSRTGREAYELRSPRSARTSRQAQQGTCLQQARRCRGTGCFAGCC
eukprot:m.123669 g.123669  ORF g.123669 m.123669 type:complete len:184 (+) comp9654_c0_seq2:309-860(+)